MSRNPNYRYLRELQVSQRCSHRKAEIICLVELNHLDVIGEVQGVLHGVHLLCVWRLLRRGKSVTSNLLWTTVKMGEAWGLSALKPTLTLTTSSLLVIMMSTPYVCLAIPRVLSDHHQPQLIGRGVLPLLPLLSRGMERQLFMLNLLFQDE